MAGAVAGAGVLVAGTRTDYTLMIPLLAMNYWAGQTALDMLAEFVFLTQSTAYSIIRLVSPHKSRAINGRKYTSLRLIDKDKDGEDDKLLSQTCSGFGISLSEVCACVFFFTAV